MKQESFKKIKNVKISKLVLEKKKKIICTSHLRI